MYISYIYGIRYTIVHLTARYPHIYNIGMDTNKYVYCP